MGYIPEIKSIFSKQSFFVSVPGACFLIYQAKVNLWRRFHSTCDYYPVLIVYQKKLKFYGRTISSRDWRITD